MKNLIKYAFSIKILYICIMLISIICSVIAKQDNSSCIAHDVAYCLSSKCKYVGSRCFLKWLDNATTTILMQGCRG